MGLSNRQAEDFFNFFYRNNTGPVTAPTQLWLSLHSSPDPGTANEIQPIGTNGYSRVNVATPTSFWSAPSGVPRQITNNNVVTFPQVTTANWGQVLGLGIWRTSGSTLAVADFMWGGSTTARTMNVGDQYQFAANQIVLKAG